ncbi:hypothetical protein [Micromonospora sp. NPDC048063]
MNARIIVVVGTPTTLTGTEPDHTDLRRLSHVDHPPGGPTPP